MRKLRAMAVGALLVVSAGGAWARPTNGQIEDAFEAARWQKEHECGIATIACGDVVVGEINGFECNLGGGNYVDFWRFQGSAGQRVTIEANSATMDTFLSLLDSTPTVRASDDDSGPGTDSLIEFDLPSGGLWTIGVSNIVPFDLGTYILSLDCSTNEPPPPPPQDPPHPTVPPLTSSQYPDFRFWVEIADQRIGTHGPSCLPETVCVAGAIPTRAEVFLRIIGPRQGRLWPSIIKFNTPKTEVWIEQISTGQINYYLLPALAQDSASLPGLLDKNGFPAP